MESKALKKEDSRIELRVSMEDKQLFEHASHLQGFRSVSAFLRSVLKREAKAIVEEERNILKTERDREVFFNALMGHEESPNQALLSAIKFHDDMLST